MNSTAYIALGSNLPFEGIESPALLARAVAALQEAGMSVRVCSGIWRTAAWPPDSGQPDYCNAVVALDPGGRSPQAVYEVLRVIETQSGRERREKWAARTLDLDIIAIDDRVGTFGGINLPHPHMHERAFVLAPLTEIAPGWRHPVLGKSAEELFNSLKDAAQARRVADLQQ